MPDSDVALTNPERFRGSGGAMGHADIEPSAATKSLRLVISNFLQCPHPPEKAGERIRTVDIHVGNVTLYH